MEMEKPGFSTFLDIKKYALKLVKVMQNQRRKPRPLNLVDAFQGQEEQAQLVQQEQAQADDDAKTEAGLQDIFSMGLAPPEQSAESAPVRPPPRDRADVQCVTGNRNGHAAQECWQPRVGKSQRKCFPCDKPGHFASECKERNAPNPGSAAPASGRLEGPRLFGLRSDC